AGGHIWPVGERTTRVLIWLHRDSKGRFSGYEVMTQGFLFRSLGRLPSVKESAQNEKERVSFLRDGNKQRQQAVSCM
ncbi:MAG: hypothetical protein M3Y60_10005, partial [Bacteroidota bacterium]|nr:hypothetical protein [Bacteroidota bacterium]